jgi:hypothetical protein
VCIKKVQPKISRVKNANIFKRKKQTKFARAEFIEDDCSFWRFRHVKNTVLEIDEYRTHIKYNNNITSKKDRANVLDHIFATSKSTYKIHIAFGVVLVHESEQPWEHYTILPPMQKFFL